MKEKLHSQFWYPYGGGQEVVFMTKYTVNKNAFECRKQWRQFKKTTNSHKPTINFDFNCSLLGKGNHCETGGVIFLPRL